MSEKMKELLKLTKEISVIERMELVGLLWDDLLTENEIEIIDAERSFVKERYNHYKKNPNKVSTVEDVRTRLAQLRDEA